MELKLKMEEIYKEFKEGNNDATKEDKTLSGILLKYKNKIDNINKIPIPRKSEYRRILNDFEDKFIDDFSDSKKAYNLELSTVYFSYLLLFEKIKKRRSFSVGNAVDIFDELISEAGGLKKKEILLEYLSSLSKFFEALSKIYSANTKLRGILEGERKSLSKLSSVIWGNRDALRKTLNGVSRPLELFELKEIEKEIGGSLPEIRTFFEDAYSCLLEFDKLSAK